MTQAEAVQWLESKVGVYWDFDGQHKNQCFDSFNFFYQFITGRNPYDDGYSIDSAKDIYNVPTSLFDIIPDSADFSPQPADILIYGDKWGDGDGHVEMCVAVQADGVWVVGSNFGGNPANPVQKAFRPYWLINTGFIGVLRFKFNEGEDMITSQDADVLRIINSEVKGWNFDETHAGKFDGSELVYWTGKALADHVRGAWREGDKFRTARNTQAKELATAKATVTDLSKKLTASRAEVTAKNKEIVRLNALTGEATKWNTLRTLLRELLGIK